MTKELDFDSIELTETIQASFNYQMQENPMGESKKDALRVNFNKKLKLEFHGVKVTSDQYSARSTKKFLIVQRNFFKVIDVLWENYVY